MNKLIIGKKLKTNAGNLRAFFQNLHLDGLHHMYALSIDVPKLPTNCYMTNKKLIILTYLSIDC